MLPMLRGAAFGASGPICLVCQSTHNAMFQGHLGWSQALPFLSPGGRPVSLENTSAPTRDPWLKSSLLNAGALIHKCSPKSSVMAAVVSVQTPIQSRHTHPLGAGTISHLCTSLGIALSRSELHHSVLSPHPRGWPVAHD